MLVPTPSIRRALVASVVAFAFAACGATPEDSWSELPSAAQIAPPVAPAASDTVTQRPVWSRSSESAERRAEPAARRAAPVVDRSPDVPEPLATDELAAVEDGAVRVEPVPSEPPLPPAPTTAPVEVAEEEIDQVWLDLAECESNQRWDYNGSSGYDGGLQFSPQTWLGVGGDDFAETAWQATPYEQVTVAERLLETQGWNAWPACSRKLGLR
ncbi:MAG: transglycosylase family protein [Ilumatobacter sp.]|uniref:transglycosylase family protein n=1 Tax=Ilumatobacter sp. TaxID=1967498 RepID=UPI003C78614C